MRHTTPWIVILLLSAGDTSEGHAASKERTVTAQCFPATLQQTIVAVSKAFDSWGYHGTLFVTNNEQFDLAKRRWTRKPTTNQWELSTCPTGPGVILVSWNKQVLPYSADFLIHAEELSTNQCKVTVTTINSSVPHGREIGIHGGWAIHYKDIPPVLSEETNVLSRVEQQLRSIQAGHVEPLPATSDVTDLRHPIKIDLTLHPEAKDDLIRAIQAETNTAIKAELLKMLIAATNSSSK